MTKLKPNQIQLHTNYGDILIDLLPDAAPANAKNIYDLAAHGKYDEVIFHRVIAGFMIQGGDYENGNGTGGDSFVGGNLDDEISDKHSHVRGIVSMANSGPNTNGSQFFIVHQDATFLDGKYTIFGQVQSGMDVVDEIAELSTDFNDRPRGDVIIKKISVGEWKE